MRITELALTRGSAFPDRMAPCGVRSASRWHAWLGASLLALGLALIGPAPAHAAAGSAPASDAVPMSSAESELFEVVLRLQPEGLVLWVDETPSNVPVLDARLEIELDGQTVLASFRPATADYLVSDAGFLARVGKPGEHLLTLTITHGQQADLLSADLDVESPDAEAGSDHGLAVLGLPSVWLWGAVPVALVMGAVLLKRRRTHSTGVTP